MTPHEILLYFSLSTWSKPRYLRVEYSHVSGHFFVRSRVKKGVLELSTRDSRAVRFDHNPNMRTDAQILEWLKDRVCAPVTAEEAVVQKMDSK